MLVALALTVKVLIPASPPAISPPEKLLFGNDDLLNRSLPSLEYIKTLQPENIPGLHTVSLYSRNDSLKLDYCYPDTLITRLIAPTISPTQTDHPDHQYQTFLATIPEKQKGFFSIEYPELWIPLVLCFTCLLCLSPDESCTWSPASSGRNGQAGIPTSRNRSRFGGETANGNR